MFSNTSTKCVGCLVRRFAVTCRSMSSSRTSAPAAFGLRRRHFRASPTVARANPHLHALYIRRYLTIRQTPKGEPTIEFGAEESGCKSELGLRRRLGIGIRDWKIEARDSSCHSLYTKWQAQPRELPAPPCSAQKWTRPFPQLWSPRLTIRCRSTVCCQPGCAPLPGTEFTSSDLLRECLRSSPEARPHIPGQRLPERTGRGSHVLRSGCAWTLKARRLDLAISTAPPIHPRTTQNCRRR